MKLYQGPVVIKYEIWKISGLSKTEKHLLNLIDVLSQQNGGCYASNYYLAEHLQISEKTVANLKSKLRKEKYLIRYKNSCGKVLHRVNLNSLKELPLNKGLKNPKTGKKVLEIKKKSSQKKEHIKGKFNKINLEKRKDKFFDIFLKEKFSQKEIQNLLKKGYSKEKLLHILKDYTNNIQFLENKNKFHSKGLFYYKLKNTQVIENKSTTDNKVNNRASYLLNCLNLPVNYFSEIKDLIIKNFSNNEIFHYYKDISEIGSLKFMNG